MKNMPTFAEVPELWDDDPYFQEFLKQAEFANMTERQQEQYIAKMMREWDYQNSIDFAIEKAKTRGEMNAHIETAQKMLARHEPMEKIMEYSELTEEQIKAL